MEEGKEGLAGDNPSTNAKTKLLVPAKSIALRDMRAGVSSVCSGGSY